MIIRQIRNEERDEYNQVVGHPLQSWQWGEFKKATGADVEQVGYYDQGALKNGLQLSFHKIPFGNFTVGYLPRGTMPDEQQLSVLRELGEKHNALYIKIEPNVAEQVGVPSGHQSILKFLEKHDTVPGRRLFSKHTFQLDLTKSEDKLFNNLKSKTRYNVRLALKNGVEIFENTTQEGMEQYIEILEETTKRQEFYAHTPDYFRKMWGALGDSGILRIFNAVYQEKVLVSWIMFVFNGVLYYPYGSSRNIHREVMASNLMMWEMIRFGQRESCHTFDMWGSLGPNPDEKSAWYGFHRFKEGYGGDLMQFVGSYDVVVNFPLYKIFRILEELRWKWLRFRAKLPF